MKKRNSMLALLVTLAMLATLFASALTVSAEETTTVTQVTSTMDFAALAKNLDAAAACDAIKAAGAVDASGLVLEDCYSVMATPANGGEIAYYVQKLDAGEGRVFLTAPVLDLTYWCAESLGAVLVEGSVDGVNYFQFYLEDQGFGVEWETSARTTKHLALHGAEGYQTAYIKISMLRNSGPTAGAVVKSVATAETVAAGTASVQSKIDFGSMAVTDDKAAAAETMKQHGVVESSNLRISQVYEVHTEPGGYMGEGYYVQKLEAGEGKVFDGAPIVELNYWLATNEAMQGYIKVEGSLDGETYYPFLELREGQGNAYKKVTEGDAAVVLNGAEGASVVYVRITMQHWDAPTGACVSSSIITAAVKDAPSEPDPTDPTEPEQPTEPSDPVEPPANTGDAIISVLVGMVAASAICGAMIFSKKKEI